MVNDQAQKLRELARARDAVGLQTKNNSVPLSKDLTTCKSIAVTSGKGGVGKTNIALSLAVTLAAFRKKVLLLDADLGLANVHILFGMAPQLNLSHFIDGKNSLEQIICTGPGNIDILPGASGLETLANLDLGRLERLQHEFTRIEQQYDYIIIDTGAGIGSIVTLFASKADFSLLVMTPEPTSFADAYAMVKVLYEKGTQRVGVVVNMVVSDRDGAETFDRLNALVVRFLKKPVGLIGILPVNREIPLSVRRQSILVLDKINDPFSLRIQGIARKLSGLPSVQKLGFFKRIFKTD
jgi:flagellar biosynthesis protein FlhG